MVFCLNLQLQSFETELSVPELASKEGGPEVFRGVFIRAPAILEVGPQVEVLADYPVPANKWKDSNPGVEGHEVCDCSASIVQYNHSVVKALLVSIRFGVLLYSCYLLFSENIFPFQIIKF